MPILIEADLLAIAAAAQRVAYDELGGSAYDALNRLLGGTDVWGAPDLGLGSLGVDPIGHTWTYSDGYFESGFAAAFAAVSGDRLILAFRGTNGAFPFSLPDLIAATFDPASQLNSLHRFIEAVVDYLAANAGISSILVTGHSLGGELAELFVAAYSARLSAETGGRIALGDIDLLTFGSPGTPTTINAIDVDGDNDLDAGVNIALPSGLRTGLSFGFSQDLVFNRTGGASILEDRAFSRETSDVGLLSLDAMPGLFAGLFGPNDPTEHEPALYYQAASEIAGFRYLPEYLATLSSFDDAEFRVLATDARPLLGQVDDRFVAGAAPGLVLGMDGDDSIGSSAVDGTLFVAGGRGRDSVGGGSGGDFLDGGSGDDSLGGSGGSDRLYGGAGRDRLAGGSGNDVVDGGSGFDTAVFGGNRSDYLVEVIAGSQARVTDQRPGSFDGSDTLIDVEQLQFADGAVAVPQGGHAPGGPQLVGPAEAAGSVAVALAGGGFAIGWLNNVHITGGVWVRVFDASGDEIRTARIPNDFTSNWGPLTLHASPNGGFVATWLAGTSGGSGFRSQAFDAAGELLGQQLEYVVPKIDVPGPPDGEPFFPDINLHSILAVEQLSDARFVVSVVANYGPTNTLGVTDTADYVFTYDGPGLPDSSRTFTDPPGPQNLRFPLGLSDGAYLLFSESQRGILTAQRYLATGEPAGGTIDITPASPWGMVRLAALPGGGFAVFSAPPGDDGNFDRSLYLQRYHADGARWGDVIVVTDDAEDFRSGPLNIAGTVGDGIPSHPSIAMLASGEFLVAWSSNGDAHSAPGETGAGVYAQRFSAAGAPIGGPAYVGPGGGVEVLALGSGIFGVTWGGAGQQGDGAYLTLFGDLGANAAPSASDLSRSTPEDTPANGALTATDPDGDEVSFVLVAGPAHGTLTLAANGSYSYQPGANYHGQDSFTFRASDGSLESGIGTVSLTITPVNDAPAVAAGIANQSGVAGSALSIAISAGAFTDADNDALTYTATLANGSPLPAWMSLANGVFSGVPTSAADLLSIRVTARDPAGLTAAATFDLVIAKSVTGGSANDTQLGGRGADSLSGGDGADTLAGGDNGDLLSGGNGNDNLRGDAGHDSLDGGVNNDTLSGGQGADFLGGGRGNDVLRGDEGADTFIFSKGPGRDLVSDFTVGADHLRLVDGLAVKSWSQVGSDTVIVFNEPAAQVTLVGVTGLTAATFGSLFDG